MTSLALRSPAKLNLVLSLVGKRPDGFHELRTVFERIDLCDDIVLTPNTSGKITVICNHPHVPKGGKNLVVRAAKQLQQDFGITQGVTIRIHKRIPVAAGLGGGSSNAATVLLGLNRLWRLGLNQKRLAVYADRLGSDITFFIYNTPFALGTGRGERIKPLLITQKLWHVLVTPKVRLYTKEVFARACLPKLNAKAFQRRQVNLRLTKKTDGVNILLPYLRKGALEGLGRVLSNDLEPAILALRPDFIRLKNKFIDAGAVGVCFSGSGPSVFALARSQAHAQQIKRRFDGRYSRIFVVSTL